MGFILCQLMQFSTQSMMIADLRLIIHMVDWKSETGRSVRVVLTARVVHNEFYQLFMERFV